MFFAGTVKCDARANHAAGRKKVHPTLAHHDTRRTGGGFRAARLALYRQQLVDAVRHVADSWHSERLHPTHHDVHGVAAAHFHSGAVHARHQRTAALLRGMVITVVRSEQFWVGIPRLAHHQRGFGRLEHSHGLGRRASHLPSPARATSFRSWRGKWASH